MRAPKLGIDPQVDHLCQQGAREGSGEALADRGRARARRSRRSTPRPSATSTGPGASRSSRRARRALIVEHDEHDASDARAAPLRHRRVRARAASAARYVLLGPARSRSSLGAARRRRVVRDARAAAARPRSASRTTTSRTPTEIAAERAVTGYLGKRASPVRGRSRRVRRAVARPASKRVVTRARRPALPNIDVDLSLTDGDGLHGATADEAGVGEGEVLHRRSIDGPLVVTVVETMRRTELPVENVSDPYTLTVTRRGARDGEIEPNDIDADANAARLTEGAARLPRHARRRRHAALDGRRRRRSTSSCAPTACRSSGASPTASARTPGAATVALHHGDLIRLERTDAHGSGPLVGARQAVVDRRHRYQEVTLRFVAGVGRDRHTLAAMRWFAILAALAAACGDDHGAPAADAPLTCPVTPFAEGRSTGHPDPLQRVRDRGARRAHPRRRSAAGAVGARHVARRRLRPRERQGRARDRGRRRQRPLRPVGRPPGRARAHRRTARSSSRTNFGEFFLLTGRSTVVTDSVIVIADGSDGGPAIIRARGKLHPLPFFESVIAVVYQRRPRPTSTRRSTTSSRPAPSTSTSRMRYASPRAHDADDRRRRCTR